MAIAWVKVADVASRSDPSVTHTVKVHPETGHLGCDCMGYRFNHDDPKRCKHTVGTAEHPAVKPYMLTRLVMSAQGIVAYKNASGTETISAIVGSMKQKAQQKAAASLMTGAQVAPSFKPTIEDAMSPPDWTNDVLRAMQSVGVNTDPLTAKRLAMALRQRGIGRVVASVSVEPQEQPRAGITRRIILED